MRALLPGPAQLDDLEMSVPRPTRYAIAKRLVAWRLLRHEKRVRHSITDLGRRELAALDRPRLSRPRLPLPDFEAPTSLHRSVIELILQGAAVRWHKVRLKHLPSVVLAGKGLRLKTWTAEAASLLAGGNPKTDVLRLFRETPGSIGLKRLKGTVEVRRAFTAPVVGLDEYLRVTDPKVKKICFLYLFGETQVSGAATEGEPLEILATPVLTLNPGKEDSRSVAEITGLDTGSLRRCIVADMTSVVIPNSWKSSKGDRVLEQIEASAGQTLPKPKYPDYEPDDRVRDVLERIVTTEEHLDAIDVAMLAQLVMGATAWNISKEEAFQLTMWNYGEVAETTGLLKDSWRRILEDLFMPHVPPVKRRRTTAPPEPNETETVRRLQTVVDLCKELEIPWTEAARRLRSARDTDVAGFPFDNAMSLARLCAARGLGPVETTLDLLARGVLARELGLGPNRLKTLKKKLVELEATQFDEILGLLDLGFAARKSLFDAEDLDALGQEFSRKPDLDGPTALDHLKKAVATYGDLTKAIGDARPKLAELEHQIKACRDALELMRKDPELRATVKTAQKAFRSLDADANPKAE